MTVGSGRRSFVLQGRISVKCAPPFLPTRTPRALPGLAQQFQDGPAPAREGGAVRSAGPPVSDEGRFPEGRRMGSPKIEEFPPPRDLGRRPQPQNPRLQVSEVKSRDISPGRKGRGP